MGNLLSFCIPTYNRADVLKQIIERLVPICEEHDIDIYVSENASPDHTQEVMKVLVYTYPFIKYHRHPENIGPDDNFEFVLKMSTTKYRWLLSDTCYVDNIDSVVNDLNKYEYDAYIVNGDINRSKYLPKTQIDYHNSVDLMCSIGWHLTWISSMIYNESLISSLDFTRYKNSSFNQTAIIFEPSANRNSSFRFNPNVVVKCLPILKDSAWTYKVFDVFYRDWYLFVMSLPLYYSHEVKLKCIRDHVSKAVVLNFRMHAKRRGEGKWDARDVVNNSFFIKTACGGYWKLRILATVPSMLISILFKFVHHIRVNYFKLKPIDSIE